MNARKAILVGSRAAFPKKLRGKVDWVRLKTIRLVEIAQRVRRNFNQLYREREWHNIALGG